MTVTKDDFEKVWASSSPLTPYSFSESQYKEGWNFIGSTPPSRQMWDFLQKNNDEKMQYLLTHFDNYLPLSGGTLTGVVNGVTPPNGDNSKKLATTEFVNAKAGNYLPLSGGTVTGLIQCVDNGKVFAIGKTAAGNVDLCWNWANKEGAGLALRSTDYSSPGEFSLFARDSANNCSLVGKPDGSLTWGGVSITDGSFLTVRNVNVTTTQGTTTSYSISAPAVSGYQFLCWVMSATKGYVSFSYIAAAWSANTSCWIGSPVNGSFDCTALYIRKW